MIKVIGSKSCSRCEVVKTILKNKSIEYQYFTLDSLSDEDKDKYLNIARKEGVLSLPIILKDERLTTLEEVQTCI